MKSFLCIALLVIFSSVPSSLAEAQSCLCTGVRPVPIGVNTQGPLGPMPLNPTHGSLARNANLGWVRTGETRWSIVNPSAGVWDFAKIDDIVTDMETHGQQILAILYHPPVHAGGNTCGTKAPYDITLWEEYVRLMAQRYAGRIDAYEIWNEPDGDSTCGSNDGIGWEGAISTYPTYTDYLRAASNQIRTWAPGTTILAGAFKSQAVPRTQEIAAQIHNTNSASYFDVLSIHARGITDEHSSNTTNRLKTSLDYINVAGPSLACKPKWVTEYGFNTTHNTQTSQKDKIRRMTEVFAGSYDTTCSGYQRQEYAVDKAFIYLILDGNETRGIYSDPYSSKAVVYQYLQTLPYPAADQ